MSATGCLTKESPHGAALSIRRLVNDQIAELARRVPGPETEQFEFVCECGKLACDGHVSMTLAEYQKLAPGSVLSH